jgi:hypothetical protein
MRLIAASDAGAVERARAEELLLERTVLATSVVRELQKDGGTRISGRPAAALGLLRRWVAEQYEGGAETHAHDGLSTMLVPEGYERTRAELVAATDVCEALARAWTADTERELQGDLRDLEGLVAGYAW